MLGSVKINNRIRELFNDGIVSSALDIYDLIDGELIY